MIRIFTLLFLLIACTWLPTKAQDWEIGGIIGTTGYMGDLNPEAPFKYQDAGGGLSVKYVFNHTWGLRGGFSVLSISGHDSNSRFAQRKNRNLNFFNTLYESSLVMDFNFFKFMPQRGRVSFTPYIFAGVSHLMHNPKWYDLDNNSVSLRDLRTTIPADLDGNQYPTYNKHAFAIPFGVGFKYNLRGPWSIGIEIGYRQALTDYLDDVSERYPNMGNEWYNNIYGHPAAYLTDPSLTPYPRPAQGGVQRGDGRPYDSYMIAGFTVSYTIFKFGCPEWQN